MMEMMTMNKNRFAVRIACLLLAAAVGYFTNRALLPFADRYIGTSHQLTMQLQQVQSEERLVEFCYQLHSLEGVTGVSYQNYSALERTATVRVFYNPAHTTPRMLRVFLQHSELLIGKPLSA
ncbi:MAG: hypothetical protein DYG96_13665 [Chlorobi bacterium CHB2]|nr:hypothetical protein [Chlorobi bacterium CHB2]